MSRFEIHPDGWYAWKMLPSEDSDDAQRSVIIGAMEFGWLQAFCPELWSRRPPSRCSAAAALDVGTYLDEVVGAAVTATRSLSYVIAWPNCPIPGPGQALGCVQ